MLNKIQLRFLLFLFGCIGSRFTFTLISAYSSGWALMLLGFLALIPVLGWSYIIFIQERDTGFEIFGEKIWWKNLRPIHLLLWLLFAYLAILGNTNAWIVLFIDTVFGLLAFLLHHYYEGNFNKLT
jgi:hypothetical protein